MASITSPHESNSPPKAKNPAMGRIQWNATKGLFTRYYPAEKDGSGNIVREKFVAETPCQKFFVIGTDFMQVTGGKTSKQTKEFVGVSSPINVTDKGQKWEQEIAIFVGRDIVPTIKGKWSIIKAEVESMGGKYSDILFVIAPQFPNELLILEMKGYEISALGEAMKQAGIRYKSGIAKKLIVLESVETYHNEMKVEFKRPVFAIQEFLSPLTPAMIGFGKAVDTFGDELAAWHNRSPDEVTAPPPAQGAAPAYAQETPPPPSAPPPALLPQGPDNLHDLPPQDDLPF